MAANWRFPGASTLIVWAVVGMMAGCGESSFTGATSTRKDVKPTDTKTPTNSANATPSGAADPALGSSSPGTGTNTNGTTPGDNQTDTTDSQANVPQGAVTKGSFTVWAEPPNPAAFEDYQIFIKVSLPSGTTQYLPGDISGTLVGTDDYRQPLSESIQTSSYKPGTPTFNFAGQTAQISLWVPGSFSKVQDSVQVRSALLNESQNITIVFQ